MKEEKSSWEREHELVRCTLICTVGVQEQPNFATGAHKNEKRKFGVYLAVQA